MSESIHIREISAEDTIPLRHSVLWPNHPVSHVILPDDTSGVHYGVFIPDLPTPIAVVSVQRDPIPSEASDGSTPRPAAHFRKFACDPAYQGRGIGTLLLRHIFEVAMAEMGCSVVWCDARLSAAGWYERRGMVKFGDTFFKNGIEYVGMKLESRR